MRKEVVDSDVKRKTIRLLIRVTTVMRTRGVVIKIIIIIVNDLNDGQNR